MPNGYFLIKQRETGAGGPPASLSAGQFAFNKVDSTLYLGTSAEIVPVGGTGTFATKTFVTSITADYPKWDNVFSTVQSNSANWNAAYTNLVSNSAAYLSGFDLTSVAAASANWNAAYYSLSNYLLLSGGLLTGDLSGTNIYANTAVLGTSSTLVATTAFVQNTISANLTSVPTSDRTIALVKQVTNAEESILYRGDVVYSYGATGNRVSVKKAFNSSDITSSKTLGLVMDTIAVGGVGYVMLAGSMDKLNLGDYVEGDVLWLGSTPGTFTKTKAIAPQHLVYIGVVERANNGDGTAYIKIQNGYELNEIHDVLINGTSAGQFIRRNTTNTLWTNQTLPTENWNSVYSNVNSTSADWNAAYTNLVSNSAAYLSGFDLSLVAQASASWDSVYSTVKANSAEKWNYQGTDLKELSGSWQSTYTTVSSNSATWNNAYTTISSSDVKTKVITVDTNIILNPTNSGEIIRVIALTNPLTISIPKNEEGNSFAVGTQIVLFNISTNSIYFSSGPDVILYSSGNNFVLSGLGDSASLVQTDLNEWVLCGNLTS